MRRIFLSILAASLACAPLTAYPKPDKLLEFELAGESYRGRVTALGNEFCWVMQRDGRLNRIRLRDIERFRTVSNRFRPYRAADIRARLRREFGKDYEVAGSTHYLVCAPIGRGRQYAQVFEEVYRQFRRYFSARGFRLQQPEFPLIAVVFRDRGRFAQYTRRHGVNAAGLVGYYSPASNRVALHEAGSDRLSRLYQQPAGAPFQAFLSREPVPGIPTSFGTGRADYERIQAGLQATMIHEATHQAAFNTGLHSRVGENPRWIVEGLATVFESTEIRQGGASARASAASRINFDQLIAFQNFLQKGRRAGSLESFLADDDLYKRSVSDFYGQAWAFSLFLMETRPSRYARLLKRVAQRDPLSPYPPEERLADFRETVSGDLDWLETDFLRFMAKLTAERQESGRPITPRHPGS